MLASVLYLTLLYNRRPVVRGKPGRYTPVAPGFMPGESFERRHTRVGIRFVCVGILSWWGVSLAVGDEGSDYTTVGDFAVGTDEQVLRPWSVPEPFRSTVTRLAVAVVLIEEGTARVLRIDHDVSEDPAKAQVRLDAGRSALSAKAFQSLLIRHRGLKYHTLFQVVLLDPSGREIPGPLVHAGPDHWRTDELRPSDFTWPDPKPEKLCGIALAVRREDGNRKGTLLLQWIRWR